MRVRGHDFVRRHRLLRRLREWLLVTRFNRPIGTWLLLWPVLWALWLAGDGKPNARLSVIFVAGTFLMRSAGCIINDFFDRDIDPQVQRTRDRPLAARRMGPGEALILFAVLVAAAFALVCQLNTLAFRLSFVGAGLTISYPLFKRFFPAPQLYLGLAFGWGVPMVFAAHLGAVPRVGWLLLFVAIVWAAIYDTQYAMVDRDDDRRIGVHSTALLFGDMDRVAIALLQAMMLFGLVLAGRSMQFGRWYQLGLIAAALFFLYQQWLTRTRESEPCFRAFLNNNYVGMSVFIGILLDYQFR